MAMAKRKCIFCGTTPVSREHVFPDWAYDTVSRDPRGIAEDSEHSRLYDGQLVHSWKSKQHIDFVANCVCKRCNETWMSAIENRAKPIISEMIADGEAELSTVSQRIIAQWLCLKAIVGRYSHQPVRPIAPNVARRFFETSEPPDTSQMWLARYRGDQPASLSSQVGEFHLANVSTGTRLTIGGFVSVISIGYFAGQVFECEQLVPIPSDPAALIQIWPNPLVRAVLPTMQPPDLRQAPPRWPPRLSIDNEGLQALRNGPAGMTPSA